MEFDLNQTFEEENFENASIETPFFDEMNKVDISISILLDIQDYCKSQGLNLCERLNNEDILDLINLN